MGPIGSGTLRPRQRRTRRFTFLALVALALAAPAGWVLAREASQPYVVLFDDNAVGVGGGAADEITAPAGNPTSFRESASPTYALRAAGSRVDAKRVASHVREIEARDGVQVGDIYSNAVGGFSANLNARQRQALEQDPTVAAIVPDDLVQLDDGSATAAGADGISIRTTTHPDTRIPPGVRRIGAESSNVTALSGHGSGVNADVAIIDTGIDRTHPDLNVVGGYNCTGRNRDNWDDDDGHGTHVAGIVGGMGKAGGVAGVAPGVRLWSVKVLNSGGSGYVSWLVCGIDWVTAQREHGNPGRPLFEAANMSISYVRAGGNELGCADTTDPVHVAICRSVAAGTVYAVAAGNEAHNARMNRPAAYDEVITVGAIADYDGHSGGHGQVSDSCPYWTGDPDDSFASFSNYGPDVDLVAPGRCVLSTYPHDRYAWMSGTSMATPHVTGAVAVYRTMFPRATPQQVRMALQAVGTLDWRTSTYPYDGTPPKALWIGDFRAVPDFWFSASAAAGSAAPGGQLTVGVSIGLVGGFASPVSVSLLNPPTGFDATAKTINGGSGSLTVSVDTSVRGGPYSLTLRARGGDVDHFATISVVVLSAPPQARFTSPRAGLTLQARDSVDVAWTESSGGATITGRVLVRQVGRINTPGTCDGVQYTTDLARPHPTNLTDTARTGFCYRWALTLSDAHGNRTTAYSGNVLVDTTAPAAPSVNLAAPTSSALDVDSLGVNRAYIGSGGTIWVRSGIGGTVDLEVSSRDAESGIASNTVSLDRAAGWTAKWVGQTSGGALRLYYTAHAGDSTLSFRATNGVGLTGSATVGTLQRDSVAPTPVAWSSLPTGSSYTGNDTSALLRWTGGADSDSGVAHLQVVRRYRSPISANGTCQRNGWVADGPYRLAANGTVDTGLLPGYCYAWAVRTLDNVGNFSDFVVSGYFIDTPHPR
jgi:subtilisin family serine protease